MKTKKLLNCKFTDEEMRQFGITLAQEAQEMRVSPAEAGSASVAAGGGSKVSEQSSSASVAR